VFDKNVHRLHPWTPGTRFGYDRDSKLEIAINGAVICDDTYG